MPDLPRVLSSETVYRGRLFNVELDKLAMDGGVIAQRETLRHPGAVCMIPVLDDDRLAFVTQYRHPTGRRLLELPAGTLEKGEQPASAAVRELQEEIGYRPRQCEPLGGFFVAPGYSSEYIHLFACTGLEASQLPGDEDEDIEVEALTLEDALSKIETGDICDAKSVIGVLRWSRRINR